VRTAGERYDGLSGRFVGIDDDLDALLGRIDDIVARLYTLRIKRNGGAGMFMYDAVVVGAAVLVHPPLLTDVKAPSFLCDRSAFPAIWAVDASFISPVSHLERWGSRKVRSSGAPFIPVGRST
jgi:hypothetical protein